MAGVKVRDWPMAGVRVNQVNKERMRVANLHLEGATTHLKGWSWSFLFFTLSAFTLSPLL